jgi:hypothetical protein
MTTKIISYLLALSIGAFAMYLYTSKPCPEIDENQIPCKILKESILYEFCAEIDNTINQIDIIDDNDLISKLNTSYNGFSISATQIVDMLRHSLMNSDVKGYRLYPGKDPQNGQALILLKPYDNSFNEIPNVGKIYNVSPGLGPDNPCPDWCESGPCPDWCKNDGRIIIRESTQQPIR